MILVILLEKIKTIVIGLWLKKFIIYQEKSWGTFAIKQIIDTKQKLGMGNNFTMEDLSNELNKSVINKFKRKKVIVNYINEMINGLPEISIKYFSELASIIILS